MGLNRPWWEKIPGGRGSQVGGGPRWERYLEGVQESYGRDTVCTLYGELRVVLRVSEVVLTLYCASVVT